MLNHKLNYSHVITTFITAFIIFICINPLIDVAFHILLFDAVVSGILLTGLLMLLAYITKYGYFSSSIFRQQIINYFTLAVLFVALWPGLEYLILYISFPDEYLLFLPSLTIRIIISLLVFGLFMALFSRFNISENLKESETISVEIEKVEEPKEIIERIAVKSGQK